MTLSGKTVGIRHPKNAKPSLPGGDNDKNWNETIMIGNHVKENPEPTRKNSTKRTSVKKDFFGLLPDWKIDTQAFKDELRD